MKSDWANLPQEIVLHIFQYLSQDNRYQNPLQHLQLINKNWGRAARRILYEAITLDRSEKQVAVLLHTLESPENELLSKAVRKIRFGANAFPDEQNLRALMKICPNVAEIFTPDACNKLNYYYPLLTVIHKEGYLQRLEKVPPPGPVYDIYYPSLMTKYHDAMLCLTATATELHIDSTFKAAGSSTGLFPTVANHLADFASLKELRIRATRAIPFNQVSNLFVGNQPPQLNRFELFLDSTTPSVIYPANDICELSQVKIVSLQLHVLSAQDLCFIMRMFPNLKELHTSGFNQTAYFPQLNDSTSALTFERFSKYISRISVLELWSWVMSPEVLLESVASLAKFNKLETVWIYFTHIGEVEEIDWYIRKSVKEVNAYGDQDKTPCDLDINLSFEDAYHLELMMALLACTTIDHFTIEADQRGLDYSEKTVIYGPCLDYILSNCTTLDRLTLEGLEIDLSPDGAIINPSDKLELSFLRLKGCRVSSDAYSCMSQRIRNVRVFEFSGRTFCNGKGNPGFEDDSGFDAVQIDMPYTAFHEFICDKKWHDFAVKIRLRTETVIFRVSKEKKIQRLDDSSPYTRNFASSARDFHTLTICCDGMATFSVEGGESILL